jgi:hypothetical protein
MSYTGLAYRLPLRQHILNFEMEIKEAAGASNSVFDAAIDHLLEAAAEQFRTLAGPHGAEREVYRGFRRRTAGDSPCLSRLGSDVRTVRCRGGDLQCGLHRHDRGAPAMSHTNFGYGLPLRRHILDFEVEIKEAAVARVFDAAIVPLREPAAGLAGELHRAAHDLEARPR